MKKFILKTTNFKKPPQTVAKSNDIITIRSFITLFTIIIMFALRPGDTFAQWQWQNPLPQGNILFGSYYLNSNTGWATGDAGTIIKTTNGGLNWSIQSTLTKQSIRSVFFPDENNGIACGLTGTILKTTNGGTNWSKVVTNATGNLFCVKFLNSNTGFIVGDTGIVFKTSDAGLSWTRKQSNIYLSLTSCAIKDSIVLAAGLNGTLTRSTDYGENWQQIFPGNSNYFFDVMFKDNNTAFIAGAYGTILKSTNAGLTWSATSTSTGYWFYSISFGDANTGFVTSDYGNIFRTTNGGQNWIGFTTTTSEFQYSLKAFNINDVISVGNKGTILKTSNSGLNWSDYSSGFRNTLFAMDFLDKNNGMSCGAQGTVVLTTNSGLSWTRIQAATDNDYLNQLDFVSSNTGYCVGEEGVIIKTTNGGNNWNSLNSNVQAGLYSLHFLNDNTGWICGDSGKLLKTTNGGSSFTLIPTNSNSYISDIFFINENTGWYASGERRIYKTTNAGSNWYVPHSEVFSGGVGAVQFVDPNTGIAFTFDNKILLTSNGGSNWTQVSIPANNYLNNIFAVDDQNFWACGDYGFIYHSSNAGHSWVSESNNNFVGRIFAPYFTDVNNGWFVGGNGLIVKYTNTMSSISINSTSENPDTYKLYQNYPNPFNPQTNLQFGISNSGFVSLKVYDILGNEVAVLVNEKKNPGSYEVEFDGSNFSSGIYFYKIVINPDNNETGFYSETKSMMLVK